MKSQKILPGAKTLSRIVKLSPEAKRRLKWMDWYQAHGSNARLTCRHFGISPDTFYRWKKRFKPGYLKTLESYSTKPKRLRTSTINFQLVDLVINLRNQDPGLSKYKLQQILKRQYQVELSASSIGRILTRKGLIKKAQTIRDIKRQKRINYSIPRIRAAFNHRHKGPGHLVQIDTKHLIVLGQKFYQFTAVDCYTKFGYSVVYRNISSTSGRDFLTRLIDYFPFKIRAVHTDNGSEYLLHFHQECVKQKIKQYFSRPKTPKDNALIERFIQTTIYELWLFDETLIPELEYLNTRLSGWVGRYNHYRPHQTLKYLTPMEYYHFKTKGSEVYGRY